MKRCYIFLRIKRTLAQERAHRSLKQIQCKVWHKEKRTLQIMREKIDYLTYGTLRTYSRCKENSFVPKLTDMSYNVRKPV